MFIALGPVFMAFGVGTLALGALVYLVAAKSGGHWPFEERTP